jgi:glucan phosphorylase
VFLKEVTMTSITIHTPVKVATPRATSWAASLFTSMLSWFENQTASRAERQVQADRATEASAVREYAHRFAQHDPRFAADLLAAADRHEIG